MPWRSCDGGGVRCTPSPSVSDNSSMALVKNLVPQSEGVTATMRTRGSYGTHPGTGTGAGASPTCWPPVASLPPPPTTTPSPTAPQDSSRGKVLSTTTAPRRSTSLGACTWPRGSVRTHCPLSMSGSPSGGRSCTSSSSPSRYVFARLVAVWPLSSSDWDAPAAPLISILTSKTYTSNMIHRPSSPGSRSSRAWSRASSSWAPSPSWTSRPSTPWSR